MLIALAVPVKVIVVSALPSPLEKLRPAVLANVSVPLVTDRVTRSGLAPASTSLTLRALPLALENTRVVSSLTDCAAGTVCTGASLTAVTVIDASWLVLLCPSALLTTMRTVRVVVDGVLVLLFS